MVTITVTTARPLATTEVTAIEKRLKKRYSENSKIQLCVEPSLIGGIRIQVGTTEIDATVATKLQTIKQHLLHL